MLVRAKELQKIHLEARDGTVGRIRDLLFDDESWAIRYLVADTGGWLAGRRVLLSPAITIPAALSHGRLPVDLTRRQVERSPGLEEHAPVSAHYQRDLQRYYGWPAYWPETAAPYGFAGLPAPMPFGTPPAGPPAPSEPRDPHLRSMSQVTGYGIRTPEGAVGHVEDFIVGIGHWVVRLLIVDTRNWLPGRKVALLPESVDRVSWTDAAVAVRVSREAIEESPAWAPDAAPTDDFVAEVAAHYDDTAGRPRR